MGTSFLKFLITNIYYLIWCLRVRNSEQLQLGGSDSGFLSFFLFFFFHLFSLLRLSYELSVKLQSSEGSVGLGESVPSSLMGLLARGLTSLSDGVSVGYWESSEPSIRGKNKSDSILDLFLLL